MVKRLQKQISILDLAFGAKNLIFARNAVNTPPIFNIPQFSWRGGIYHEYNGIENDKKFTYFTSLFI